MKEMRGGQGQFAECNPYHPAAEAAAPGAEQCQTHFDVDNDVGLCFHLMQFRPASNRQKGGSTEFFSLFFATFSIRT